MSDRFADAIALGASNRRSSLGQPDLRWLLRYARHCGFEAATGRTIEQSLRAAFGPPGWRLLCRSPKSAFLPILRSRELTLNSLIAYCQRLAERSFVQAPQPILLEFFVIQRRLFHDRPCRVPQAEDYDIIRVADRQRRLRLQDIASVTNWANQTRSQIQPGHQWRTLVMRARRYNERLSVELGTQDHEPWHFHCRDVAWRGLTIAPITEPVGLWSQGQRQGNCLYQLRNECTALRPSRFFAISRQGKALATLELAWRPPQAGDRAMDRVWGQWFLQDLRLSYNRLADTALLRSMLDFAWQYNLWAKRPGRQQPWLIEETRSRIKRSPGWRNPSAWQPSFAGA